MIRTQRATTKTGLFLSMKLRWPLEGEADFHMECATERERNLLQEHVDKCLRVLFEDIRCVSYQMGWKEAKAKKLAKRTDFPGCCYVADWERKLIK